jgi:hypothetical protein
MHGQHGRHGQVSRTAVLRFAAAAVAGALGLAALLSLGSGGAQAATPTPSYHPGSDTATFTATGVLDSNCLVSIGGTAIWIKPGDTIDFNSSLAGIDVSQALLGQTLGGLLGGLLNPSDVAGLDVKAVIDSNKPAADQQVVQVSGGKKTAFPSKSQKALSPGDHEITWDATALELLPGLNHQPIPLSNSDLQSGAELSWTGVIHVTDSAPQCKLAVGTPKTKISLGPVKVTVPPINATVPVTLPTGLPKLPVGGSSSTTPAGQTSQSSTSTGGPAADTGGLTIPQLVMPQADGGVGGGVGPAGAGDRQIASGLPDNGKVVQAPGGHGSSPAGSTRRTTAVGLDSNKPSALPTMPVVLAIVAILALALVTASYARLFLIHRRS